MSYIETNEVHTQLDNLVSKKERLSKTLEEQKEKLRLLKQDIDTTNKDLKSTKKLIECHKIEKENFRKVCLECGYVESILEDIQPTPTTETKTETPTPI